MNMKLPLLSLLAACAVFTLSPAFASTQGNHEIATAIKHAGYAAKSTNLKHVDLHLHHVVNCLVGPQGGGFDKMAGDPCKGMGMGALADDAHATVATRAYLNEALTDADIGLANKHLHIAREAASMTKNALANAEDSE